jgi:heat shock protein HslJ
MISSDLELPLSLGALVHSRWKMTAFYANKQDELLDACDEISVAFDDGWVSGVARCNTFSTSMLLNNHRHITARPIATIRKHYPAKMAAERRLLQVLSEAYFYQLKANLLLMDSYQDALLATFRQQLSES